MADFFNATTHTARKDYSCDLCDATIKAGEKYIAHTGKYCGDFFSDRFHETCYKIISWYCDDIVDDNEYSSDRVMDTVQEYICNNCEHGDDEREDYTPCAVCVYDCPKILEIVKGTVDNAEIH